jgi:hypothetical protein
VFHPVHDLRAFLTGSWRIARRVHDIRQGLVGRLAGRGDFAPTLRGLTYGEAGLLRFGNYEGQAARRYLYAFDRPDTADIHHADGSLFHALNLSAGKDDIRHQCGEDHYRGRYRVLEENVFAVSWCVTGPRKCYRMATFYRRAG